MAEQTEQSPEVRTWRQRLGSEAGARWLAPLLLLGLAVAAFMRV